jgi:hypothetical protein
MVWYNPKVFGNAWMQANGFTEESVKANPRPMWQIFSFTYIFSLLAAFIFSHLCVHQMGAFSLTEGTNMLPSYDAFMADYGKLF